MKLTKSKDGYASPGGRFRFTRRSVTELGSQAGGTWKTEWVLHDALALTPEYFETLKEARECAEDYLEDGR